MAKSSPVLLLNSFGFNGTEMLATLLASHPNIGLLPGQNFIQQEHVLYRPLDVPTDNPKACFKLLSKKQFTKQGTQWAGLGKFMSEEYRAKYSIEKHEDLFLSAYKKLNASDKECFIGLARIYTLSFFDCLGDDISGFNCVGFYGGNVLINAEAYTGLNSKTSIVQTMPSPAQWLALASQARTWNPESAFQFYLIQNLFLAKQELSGTKIHYVCYSDLVSNTKQCINNLCSELNIPLWENQELSTGEGHAPLTEAFINKIIADSEKITQIYKDSYWFDLATGVDDWKEHYLNQADAIELLDEYQQYWNSTSHIAFDWMGPLEQRILQSVQNFHATKMGTTSNPNDSTDGIAYQFYQKWYELSSLNHNAPVGKPCFPLGDLEKSIPVPELQYFMSIAIEYLRSSATLQSEKAHSYRPIKNSIMYKRLCEASNQQLIKRFGLTSNFSEMESAIDDADSVFEIETATVTQITSGAIAVSGPSITEHENKTVLHAMSDWYDKPYHYCEEFERRFAEYHDRQFALMTPNCTSANHLLLQGLGIGPGDEVLVPECTWIATASPAYYCGATPVFCDINEDDWCISIESMRQNLTPSTKAIIVVNIYGNMAKMDLLEDFANEHDLMLIEDAAESVGSVYKNRKSGSFGVGSVFSFHRTKTLTTGEGGMLLIDDEELFKRCTKLRDHGRGPDTPAFTHEMVTHKYMPFNVQAALGLAQFERLDELVGKKRHILSFYKEHLAHLPDIQFNEETPDIINSAWCSTLVLGHSYTMRKQALMGALQQQGIPSRPFFYPLSSQPGIKLKIGESVDLSLKNSMAYDLSERGINLPSALNLTDAQLEQTCKAVEQVLLGQSNLELIDCRAA